MKILVLNSGSSSLKYQLFSMPQKEVICSGIVDRIGLEGTKVEHKTLNDRFEENIKASNHNDAINYIVNLLVDKNKGAISNIEEIEAVGHRVVHGGSAFKETMKVTDKVKNQIKDLFELAPLHNPTNLEGINVAEKKFVNATQVAVFDTAFHQSIPEVAYKYAIPNKFLDDHHVRLYGFHGTSHKYVSERAIEYLDKKQSRIITIHLGNGCSITAVKNGKSIDHSLGFSPVNGLIMGTRSGDIDHSLIFYLVNTLNYDIDKVNSILQKKSGMLGLTGYSDLRDIEKKANNGNDDCKLAIQMNAYRIRKYIGAYTASMNGLDCLVFTAGIGENSSLIRELVCTDMDYLGIELDLNKNAAKSKDLLDLSAENSKVKILVIPTNEELEIAKQTYNLLKTKKTS